MSTGHWESIDIRRHRVWLYVPRALHPRGFSLLYLHDVDGETLRERHEFTRLFDQHGLRVAIPEAGPTWWLDQVVPAFDPRQSAQDFLANDVLAGLTDHWQLGPKQLGVLGIGMGGQGALQLSYRDPQRFPVVAAIAPAVDFHQLVPHEDPLLTETFGSREWARQHTAILHIHPLNWPPQQFFCCDPEDYAWFDSSDRLRMKLQSIGIRCECDLETSGGGHGWEYFDRMAPRTIQFLVDGLEQERTRIV